MFRRILLECITALSLVSIASGFGSLRRMSAATMSASKHTLYDVPVSNNGARCRLILYKKKIPSNEVQIISPMELGGLKSTEYLALNPQGKMPCLSINGDAPYSIPESDTICRYLISRYADTGPTFLPDSHKSNLVARLHDMYITTIQGCLYKAAPPFGMFMTRSKAIEELKHQLDVIDKLVEDEGLYLMGNEVSLGDVSLFPTMIFVKFMLPKFGESDILPTNLEKWYNDVIENDSDFAKVNEEILTALKKWSEGGRWDSIWMAGLRDEESETIFDKIIAGDIPASIVYDDEDVLAFKDIAPAAPAHVLVIPKDRANLSSLSKASKEHTEILGKMLIVAGDIAKDENLGFTGDGARLVINDGANAGQEVPHLHMHVLGGRKMDWPPG